MESISKISRENPNSNITLRQLYYDEYGNNTIYGLSIDNEIFGMFCIAKSFSNIENRSYYNKYKDIRYYLNSEDINNISLKDMVNKNILCEYKSYCTNLNKKRKEIDAMRINNFKNKIENYCEEALYKYLKDSIKNHFGKEYKFECSGNNIGLISEITKKFLKVYDNNFKKHTSYSNFSNSNIEREYNNTRAIIYLEKGTYIYLFAGKMNENDDSDDVLYLYIFGKNCYKYIKELNRIIKVYKSDIYNWIYTVDKKVGINNNEGLFVVSNRLNYRDLNTIFFSHNEKETVINHINKWKDNKDFYAHKELIYKTGILLYGEPGVGKSSFVKAIAGKYGADIVNINMSNIADINLNELSAVLNVDSKEQLYIILLEDIDTAWLDRKNVITDKEDQAVINKLLQFLDSNTSPNNVIFIATTNHIERLDNALLRDGRFDLKVEVKPLKRAEAMQFCKSFGLSNEISNEILDDSDSITRYTSEVLYNQSSLQNKILSRIENKSIDK